MNQKQFFYESHLWHSSDIHLKMAKLQRDKGNEKLAIESEKTALSRRISARNLDGFKGDVSKALDYGEWAVKQSIK